MAIVKFRGMCSGTDTRKSEKTGSEYSITSFVEIPSMRTFSVFGDLNLPATETVKDYEFDCGIEKIFDVKPVGNKQ